MPARSQTAYVIALERLLRSYFQWTRREKVKLFIMINSGTTLR